MDIVAVMDDLGAALETISGLRVVPYWPGSVTPPAAVVGMPDVEFDAAYARGADRMSVPVHVLVSFANPRAARSALAGYVAGSGSSSVKAAIDGHTPTAYDVATVQRVQHTTMTVGDTTYLAATFTIDIVGAGE